MYDKRGTGILNSRLVATVLPVGLFVVALLWLSNTRPVSVWAEGRHVPLPAPQLQNGTPAPSPVPTATRAPSSEDRLIDLEARLAEAWEQHDWLRAIDIINQILQIDPNRTGMRDNLYAAHVNYGFQLYNEGKLEQAKIYFTRATEIRPEYCEDAKYGLSLIQAAILTVTPVASRTPATGPSPTPGGTVTPHTGYHHVIQTGDTLYALARHYNTSVGAIMRANGLTSYIIWVGQTLYIPPTGSPTTPGPTIHTVLPGETLWSLARRYQTTVQAIMWANRMWDYTIYAGQLLIIPAPTEPAGPSERAIHTVKSGETLYGIAQRYSTNVAAIMRASGLDSTLIHPGQLLIIPANQ